MIRRMIVRLRCAWGGHVLWPRGTWREPLRFNWACWCGKRQDEPTAREMAIFAAETLWHYTRKR